MFFYQQAGFPSNYYRQPVHRMYLQYQQPYRAAAQRRSAVVPSGGISAYVAGNQVAASGSFLQGLKSALARKLAPLHGLLQKKIHVSYHSSTTPPPSADADQVEPEILADELPVENDDAVSIAEAYPPAAAEESDEPQHDELDVPVVADAPVAAEAPVAADVPQNKNKVTVELDTAVADEEDALAVQHDEVPAYNKARRPANAQPAQPASNPVYFPINFGNTNGGAIAVANAYSTGQKGGARSHAIAYGSPAESRKRTQRRKATSATAVNE